MEVCLWPCIGFVAVVMRAISQDTPIQHQQTTHTAHSRRETRTQAHTQ